MFEREQGDTSLFKEIHEEFASMVDTLIECFCDDLHIKAEQLVAALKHQDNNTRLSLKERVICLCFYGLPKLPKKIHGSLNF